MRNDPTEFLSHVGSTSDAVIVEGSSLKGREFHIAGSWLNITCQTDGPVSWSRRSQHPTRLWKVDLDLVCKTKITNFWGRGINPVI
jgi:hypothetical protein